MAESLNPVAEALKCSICLETLRRPKSLSCLHSFCEECIQSVITAAGRTDRVTCPDCRQQTPLTRRRGTSINQLAGTLPHNFPLQNIIDGLRQHRKDKHEESARQCLPSEICVQHPPEKLSSYCRDHDQSACRQCVKGKHGRCDVVKIERVAKEIGKNEYLDILNDIKTVQKDMTSSISAIQRNIVEITAEVNKFPSTLRSLEEDVRKLVKIVSSDVESRTEELTCQLTKKQQDMAQDATSWVKALETTSEELQLVFKHGTEVQRFIAADQMKKRLLDFRLMSDKIAESLTSSRVRMECIEVLKCVLLIGAKQLAQIETIDCKLEFDED